MARIIVFSSGNAGIVKIMLLGNFVRVVILGLGWSGASQWFDDAFVANWKTIEQSHAPSQHDQESRAKNIFCP
jgi:hypothetical protein